MNPRGRLGHFELYSPDVDDVRALYSELFDWAVENTPGYNYALITTGAPYVSGGFGQSADEAGLVLYFFTPDMRQTLRLAEQAGARVIDPMFSIEIVTVARLRDTNGNVFGLWTTRDEVVAEDPDRSNPIIGFEIGGDPVHLGSFYRWTFDWKVHADNGTVFTYDGVAQGRIVPMNGWPHTAFVVRVSDLDDFEQRATKAGCKLDVGNEHWLDGSPMLHFSDPWNVHFAVVQPRLDPDESD